MRETLTKVFGEEGMQRLRHCLRPNAEEVRGNSHSMPLFMRFVGSFV